MLTLYMLNRSVRNGRNLFVEVSEIVLLWGRVHILNFSIHKYITKTFFLTYVYSFYCYSLSYEPMIIVTTLCYFQTVGCNVCEIRLRMITVHISLAQNTFILPIDMPSTESRLSTEKCFTNDIHPSVKPYVILFLKLLNDVDYPNHERLVLSQYFN